MEKTTTKNKHGVCVWWWGWGRGGGRDQLPLASWKSRRSAATTPPQLSLNGGCFSWLNRLNQKGSEIIADELTHQRLFSGRLTANTSSTSVLYKYMYRTPDDEMWRVQLTHRNTSKAAREPLALRKSTCQKHNAEKK